MKFKFPRTRTKMLLSGVGFLLFAYLILRIGVGVVLESVSRFGAWFAAILFLGACWLFFQACAWSIIQNAYFQKVPFFRLFRIRIISDALNILLPSASLGGDAARAYMIKGNVPLKEGIPGVLFDKTIEFVATAIFLAGGLLLGILFIRMPAGLLAPALICQAVTTFGLVLLIFFSVRGFYGIVLKISGLVPRAQRWVLNREEQLRALDRNLRLLYSRANLKTAAALGLHVLARLTGVVEVLIILRVLGVPADFVLAWFISAAVIISNTIFFILPGQWGITESASMLVLKSLGHPAAIGLTLSVIRRIRKLAFVCLALVFFMTEKKGLP
jgi:uncharacterized membrane protein YbhN (UPF0104 family)